MLLWASVNALKRLQAFWGSKFAWQGVLHSLRVSGICADVIAAQSTTRNADQAIMAGNILYGFAGGMTVVIIVHPIGTVTPGTMPSIQFFSPP